MERLEFEYLKEDNICSSVCIDNGIVSIIDYTDNLIDQFCGRRPHTVEVVNQVLEERCFSRERPDKDKLLHSLGLSMYNPLDIVKVTHGVMFTDFYWIKFKGENLKWKDVNPRLKGT